MEIKEIQKSVFSVRLVKEEEVIQSFTQWASDQKIGFASFQAIGALKEVELGYYDLHKKTFLKKIFKDDLELLSGLGNISWVESQTPFVHFHASLGQRDYAVIGGHVFSAKVAVAFECFVTVYPVKVFKKDDPDIGLKVWNLENCQIF